MCTLKRQNVDLASKMKSCWIAYMEAKKNLVPFHGRDEALEKLQRFFRKDSASLLIVKGRLRIGKSRLLAEWCRDVGRAYFFSGVAPLKETTAQSQREAFARQLTRKMGIPPVQADNWGDLFWLMAKEVQSGRVVIVLDEISWIGGKDLAFLPQLQNIWELYFKKNPQLILILCGSASPWIEQNILNSTAFLGRPSLNMTLRELPLSESVKFWKKQTNHVSCYEKLKLLSITGGVPRYLESIDLELTAAQNSQQLCFDEDGMLFGEFEEIFSDLFAKRNLMYQRILETLVSGARTQVEILQQLKRTKSGRLTKHLDDLVLSGFVTKDYTWTIKNGKESKLRRYRISDNYVRFYLKYIKPNKNKIISGGFKEVSLDVLPGFDSMLELQFENLVVNNRDRLKEVLGVKNEEIIYDNPYFQTQTNRRKGCQVDYLIQTRTNNLYVCEIKFSKNPVTRQVIDEVVQKIERLDAGKQHSFRPILIHVNGVEKPVEDSDCFVKIIDFSEFF